MTPKKNRMFVVSTILLIQTIMFVYIGKPPYVYESFPFSTGQTINVLRKDPTLENALIGVQDVKTNDKDIVTTAYAPLLYLNLHACYYFQSDFRRISPAEWLKSKNAAFYLTYDKSAFVSTKARLVAYDPAFSIYLFCPPGTRLLTDSEKNQILSAYPDTIFYETSSPNQMQK